MKNGRHGALGATLPHSLFRISAFSIAIPHDHTTFIMGLASITFGQFLGGP